MNKYLASSANPKELSATVQGILFGLIPLAILLGQVYGVELTKTELVELVQAIVAIVAALVTAFGLTRKIYYKIESR